MNLLLAVVLSATCPPLPATEVPGQLMDAEADGCAVLLATEQQLLRVGPTGEVERTMKGRFAGAQLVLDAPRERVFVVTRTHGAEALEVLITARNAHTLEVDEAWGKHGELGFEAPRKEVKEHSGTSAAATVQVRPDGSLAVVTRVDSVPVRTSIVSSWAISPQGRLTGPFPIAELDGPMVGGDLVFALAPDGRGLVATLFGGSGKSQEGKGAQLYGLMPDGHLDLSFGTRGHSIDPNISFAVAAYAVSSGWMFTGTHGHGYRVVVTRYSLSGAVDTTYGKKGRQVLKPAEGAIEHPRAMGRGPLGGTVILGTRFWRHEQRARPTLITLDAEGKDVEVKELRLHDAPVVDVVALFNTPGGLRVAGFAGQGLIDDAAVTLWRPLEAVAPAREAAEPLATPPGPQPTMYRWVGRDGVEGFASSLDEVPREYRKVAKPWSPQ